MTEIVMGAVAGRRAGEGEVLVWSRDPAEPSRAAIAIDQPGLALRVIEEGVRSFPHGGGEPERIVMNDDPALDDALAASLLRRLVKKEELPDIARALAEYSRMARMGLTQLGLSPERTVMAFYSSMRRLAGKDLTLPDNRDRFLDGWSRLECAILSASKDGIDPLGSGFLVQHPSFIRERAHLTRDRETYVEDVSRGERWNITFPGRERSAAGLFLTNPVSFLHSSWSLSDPDAPGGRGYLFLAVEEGLGNWILTVDPRAELGLKPLLKILQQMELDRLGARARDMPWSVSSPRDEHQIASPRTGTALPPGDVLRAIKEWLHATVVRRSTMTNRLRNTLKFNRKSI